MQIKPILSALRRHKAGTILIAMQIALTLAIVCNALFIIHQRITHLSRPSGVTESNLLTVQNLWVGVDDDATTPLTRSDLLALRQLPGVVDATKSNSYPLRGGGWSEGIRLDPTMKKSLAQTAMYAMDDHALATLGAKLIAGRNFNADEVSAANEKSYTAPPVIIITKALADKVYPDGSALGKPMYVGSFTKPSTVIGIVERLEVPWPGTWTDDWAYNVVMIPVQLTSKYSNYLVRTQPGQLEDVAKALPGALIKVNRMRVIPAERGIRTFAEVRANAYQTDRGMAVVMGVICIVLLAITAAGILGLTSFWVGQRRKQIGVRRALGATRRDILHYFLTENLLISTAGVLLGACLAIGLNLWLVSHFEMQRISLLYVLAGLVLLPLLGQAATLAPALRASRVSPVEATRSA
ncbi:MAG: FtsX-like permease family protein [Rhodanobacter sp.]